jgi:anti-sigma regulatory factor (Ser/Thr protein kinase)
VSFIDSSGMRTMIQIERLASDRGIPLVLVPPPEEVTELLRTAGIADRMHVASGADPGRLGPDFSDRVDIELEREPHAPSLARAEIREALARRLKEDDIAIVVLLTSELVTNAVIHPNAPDDSNIALRFWVYEDGVRVEVEDPGDGFDPGSRSSSSRHGGRGLFLVDRCAMSWGARRSENERGRRFCVWFEFLGSDRESAAARG